MEIPLRSGVVRPIQWAIVVFLAVSVPALRAGERPDFTGQWRLNHSESDVPMQTVRTDSIAGCATSLVPAAYSPDGERHGDVSIPDVLCAFATPPHVLIISLADPELQIRTGRNTTLTFFTDGRLQKLNRSRQETGWLITRWVNTELVTVGKGAPGMTVKTTYAMMRGGLQMVVATRIDSSRLKDDIIVRSVYDYVYAPTLSDSMVQPILDWQSGSGIAATMP